MTRAHRIVGSALWRSVAFASIGIILLVLISAVIDAPLRGYLERQANQALHGYTISIGSLDFHPIGFSIDLSDVVLLQDRNPDQPVLKIPKWSMNIQLSTLARLSCKRLSGGIVECWISVGGETKSNLMKNGTKRFF
jgi:hypothetical protein